MRLHRATSAQSVSNSVVHLSDPPRNSRFRRGALHVRIMPASRRSLILRPAGLPPAAGAAASIAVPADEPGRPVDRGASDDGLAWPLWSSRMAWKGSGARMMVPPRGGAPRDGRPGGHSSRPPGAPQRAGPRRPAPPRPHRRNHGCQCHANKQPKRARGAVLPACRAARGTWHGRALAAVGSGSAAHARAGGRGAVGGNGLSVGTSPCLAARGVVQPGRPAPAHRAGT